jgi:hypothetical protein
MAEFHCAGEIDWRSFVGHIDSLNRLGDWSPEHGRQHKRQYAQLRGGAEQCQWMSSDLTIGAGRAPTLPIPEAYRTAFAPNSRPGFAKPSIRCKRRRGCLVAFFAARKQGFFP